MRNSSSSPQPLPSDDSKMRRAIEALNEAGIRFTRPTKYQLKVDDLNFYPTKGTIFRDGDDAALNERGLEAFMALLSKPVHEPHFISMTCLVDDGNDQDRLSPIDLHLT